MHVNGTFFTRAKTKQHWNTVRRRSANALFGDELWPYSKISYSQCNHVLFYCNIAHKYSTDAFLSSGIIYSEGVAALPQSLSTVSRL